MNWKQLLSALFTSNEDGSELVTYVDIQDFGLMGTETLFALEMLERGDGEVQVRVGESHGASLEVANYVAGSDDIIASTSVGEVPTTLFGGRIFTVPYFRAAIGVSAEAGTRGSVYMKLYAGNR